MLCKALLLSINIAYYLYRKKRQFYQNFCKISENVLAKRDQKILSHHKNNYIYVCRGPSTAILSLANVNNIIYDDLGRLPKPCPFWPKTGCLPPWRGQKSTPKIAQIFYKIFSHPCATFDR